MLTMHSGSVNAIGGLYILLNGLYLLAICIYILMKGLYIFVGFGCVGKAERRGGAWFLEAILRLLCLRGNDAYL